MIALTEGDEDSFGTGREFPQALEVLEEGERVTGLIFCGDDWTTFCVGEESRLTVLR